MKSLVVRKTITRIKKKPRYIIHLGGSVLELTVEELAAGKKISKVDLKPDPVEWSTMPV